MKIKPLLIAVFFILTIQACFYPDHHGRQGYRSPHKMSDKIIVVQRPKADDTVCITAVGDIMMGSSYPNNGSLPPDSGKESFRSVTQYLKSSDVTFGNLEGTLLDNGAPAYHKLHLKSSAFLFRMPSNFGSVLKNGGFQCFKYR